VEATRGPLEALSRIVVKPEVAGSDTLEGLVRELLKPMLRDWLDANLPQIVEAMVAREITRITGRN
jgi:cell pole-organizing protein PopZ